MEMLRKGKNPFERPVYDSPMSHIGFTSVARREVRDNPVLAARIVANNIVGVRSTVEVPGKYLKYFRYRQNFLVLTCTYNIPIGLTRFLIAQWVKNPFSLWLRRAVYFKKFLKFVPISLVKQARLRLAEYAQGAYPTGAESCTPLDDWSSEYYSGGESELD